MNIVKYSSVAVRFLKGFFASGIAQVLFVLTSSGFNIHSVADAKAMLNILAMAFLTGSLLGLKKMLAYQDPNATQ